MARLVSRSQAVFRAPLLALTVITLSVAVLPVMSGSRANAWQPAETDTAPRWLKKPILHFLLDRPDSGEEALLASGFDSSEARVIMAVARDEGTHLRSLRDERNAEIYNARVQSLLSATDLALREHLSASAYTLLDDWANRAFNDEAYGNMSLASAGLPEEGVAYRVFATQFAPASGEPEVHVAVPDKYVKFASQCSTIYTWPTPPSGYTREPHYVRVYVPTTGITETLPVCETGPWNIDDNYWNAANDPERPRRTYTDLSRGNPEAQAAYFWDYNDGKDSYGRTVANPAGLDLSFAAARLLGLRSEPEQQIYENAWVWVTFLWELPGLSTRTVWPGDANADGIVDERDVLATAFHLGTSGAARDGASTAWAPQEVDTSGWPHPHAAYADANGDGVVNQTDIEVVEAHWLRQHD